MSPEDTGDNVGGNTNPPPNPATIPLAAYGALCQGHLNAKATAGGGESEHCIKGTEFRFDVVCKVSWCDQKGWGRECYLGKPGRGGGS